MASPQSFPLTERGHDEVIAYRASGPVTVGSLVSAALSLSRQLPVRKYVINVHTDRYEYLLAFCASVIAGQCTLMPPNRQSATLKQLRQTYPDSYTLGDEVNIGADLADGPGARDPVPNIPAGQLCAIAFTSGSTGAPRANLKYWRTCRAGSLSNRRLMFRNLSARQNVVATVPAQHMWGMETTVLLPLFANMTISHRVPFFPQDFVAALARVPPPRMLVSAPVHLEALLKSGVRIDAVTTIFTATAPLSRELARALEETFDTQVMEIFGCTESGILAARSTSSETLWTLSDVFSLEPKLDSFEIVAEHLPENVVLPDIIELVGRRRFRWLGRRQDMINIAGKRGSLADLNHRLKSIAGVDDGVMFLPQGRNARLAALVVAPDLPVSDILTALKEQVEPLFLPRPIYKVPVLPRQGTGKLPITAVHELYESLRRQPK